MKRKFEQGEAMRLRSVVFIAFLLVTGQVFGNSPKHKTIGSIHRDSQEIDALVPADAVIEILADGFDWSEGPVWISDGQFLLFNDIPQNTTYRWSEDDGLSIFLRPAGFAIGDNPPGFELGSNGMFVHPLTGQLIACDHGNRAIMILNRKNWTRTPLVEHYKDSRLNSPNDIVISSRGHIYFTDPPYGLTSPEFPGRELDFCGVFHVDPEGNINLVTDKLDRPNGIALSADEKSLYVANSGKQKVWMVFDVDKSGQTSNGRVFYDASDFDAYGSGGACDGMAVDAGGNVWATGPGGVMVFTPQARLLGSIDPGTVVSNCTFGGNEGNELYFTADNYLCRIKVNVRGKGITK